MPAFQQSSFTCNFLSTQRKYVKVIRKICEYILKGYKRFMAR
jgi:hypothetical protein